MMKCEMTCKSKGVIILVVVIVVAILAVFLMTSQQETTPEPAPEPFISPLTGQEVGKEDFFMDYGVTTRNGVDVMYVTVESENLYGNCGEMTGYFDLEMSEMIPLEEIDCETEDGSSYCQSVCQGATGKIWEMTIGIGS